MAYTYGTAEWDNAYREMVEERLKKAAKPYVMGTPEWVAAFEKMVQEDEEYKKVAKTWEGSVVIHILASPANGINDDLYLFMDLWHGDCRFIRLVPKDVGANANFVLTGEMERWQAVMKKELDVTKAMMQGKVKLKGSLPTIVRYVKASIRLTDLAAEIDTKFHSDLSEEERSEYLAWFNSYREQFGF